MALPTAACAGAPEEVEQDDSSDPIDAPTGSCPPCGSAQHCKNGACVDDACGPSNCATGCCSAGKCVTGTSRTACGSGGGLCDACNSEETCDADEQACVAVEKDVGCDASTCVEEVVASYQVVLVSANVASKKVTGDNWDTSKDAGCLSCFVGCCPPDVYVGDTSQFAGLPIPKMVESNTTSPSWNVIVGQLPGKSLIGASITVELKDEDTSVLTDDVIGSCTTTLTANDVASGTVTLNPSRGCTSSVQNLVFRLDQI